MFRKKAPIVVMLGVHRSGTSLSARIFAELGLRLGDRLLPGHRDNPEGFWEHGGIIAETREMERELGVNPFSGDRLVPPDDLWWEKPPHAERYQRLKAVIEEETARDGLFGFKDPRTLQLLPMWQALFKELKIDPRYVLLLRHPEAVAGSMRKRNKLRFMQGQFIWAYHISYGLQQLGSPPAAIVHYEDWFSDLSGQLSRVAPVFDFDSAGLEAAERRILEFLDTSKAHFHGKKRNGDLIPQADGLYRVLSNGNPGQWSGIAEQSRRILSENALVTEIYEGIGERARRFDLRLKEKEEELVALREKANRLATRSGPDSKSLEVYSVEPRPAAPYAAEFPDLSRFIEEINLPGQKMKVCIAAEDIVGPIRNGGIGTTYTHLSRFLSEAGHEVVIAYLRGDYCQNESIRYWIDWYKEFGVTFVPVDPDRVALQCAAPRWIRPMYALYEFLKEEKFDLVHVSEWRGSAFLSLMAKKQGLALQDTFFAVKASSPWLWNREYGYHTLEQFDDLPKMHAERRSIELADMVISGSRYLLCWMLDHGYKLPEGKCYVQPNVMVPLDLDDVAKKRRGLYGKRMPIDEIVFFGRLEYRKGLDLFFEALDRLAKLKVRLPKVTLMGKYGERIPTYPELTIPEFIDVASRKLPTKVQVLDNLGNEEALRYLLGGRRLAVMPSRIENSTLCVYETAYYGIPFVASDRGGTAELVLSDHRGMVLTDPHPVPLAEKLSEALSEGGFVARPSFNNNTNLSTWLRFHGSMGAFMQQRSQAPEIDREPENRAKLSICLIVSDNAAYAKDFVQRIQDRIDGKSTELVLVDNQSADQESGPWLIEIQKELPGACKVAVSDGLGEQYAQNLAASMATGDLLVFAEPGALLKPEALGVIHNAASSSDADLFGCFYERVQKAIELEKESGTRCGVFACDHTSAFFSSEYRSPVIAIRKEAFEKVGGFRVDYRVPGALSELVSLAKLRNVAVETIPEPIAWFVEEYAASRRLNFNAEAFRTIRPYLETAPECYKRILMAGRNFALLQESGFAGGSANPITVIEAKARKAASLAGGSPRLRNIGWKMYWLHVRIFRNIVEFEILFFKALLRIKRKLFRG